MRITPVLPPTHRLTTLPYEKVPAPGASPYPRSERREAYGRDAGLPRRCVFDTWMMNESVLAAVRELRALGAVRVRVGDVEVEFDRPEPALPERLDFPAHEHLSPERAEAEFERIAYHSA